eukprot:4317290-Amphidinium_carterae.1
MAWSAVCEFAYCLASNNELGCIGNVSAVEEASLQLKQAVSNAVSELQASQETVQALEGRLQAAEAQS